MSRKKTTVLNDPETQTWNRRCARGSMLESCISTSEDWKDERMEALLREIFSLEETREIVEKFTPKNRRSSVKD